MSDQQKRESKEPGKSRAEPPAEPLRLSEGPVLGQKDPKERIMTKRRASVTIYCDPEFVRIPVDIPTPIQPSDEERERHSLNHLPFAPWCEVCLRSRTRDNPHRSMPKEEEATSVVGP